LLLQLKLLLLLLLWLCLLDYCWGGVLGQVHAALLQQHTQCCTVLRAVGVFAPAGWHKGSYICGVSVPALDNEYIVVRTVASNTVFKS
jgi:hypothetical protein